MRLFSGEQRKCDPILPELRLRHRRDEGAVLQAHRARRRARAGEEVDEGQQKTGKREWRSRKLKTESSLSLTFV